MLLKSIEMVLVLVFILVSTFCVKRRIYKCWIVEWKIGWIRAVSMDKGPGEEKRIRVMCPFCQKVSVIVVEKDVIDCAMVLSPDYMARLPVFPGDVC